MAANAFHGTVATMNANEQTGTFCTGKPLGFDGREWKLCQGQLVSGSAGRWRELTAWWRRSRQPHGILAGVELHKSQRHGAYGDAT